MHFIFCVIGKAVSHLVKHVLYWYAPGNAEGGSSRSGEGVCMCVCECMCVCKCVWVCVCVCVCVSIVVISLLMQYPSQFTHAMERCCLVITFLLSLLICPKLNPTSSSRHQEKRSSSGGGEGSQQYIWVNLKHLWNESLMFACEVTYM